ncbi:HNH/endonuclease VII fold toxin-2 domain-containing protein [Providencia huaxiensis]|uniref:HNH/endonuclease VII fold toxin-2 domain-containing protein n=1 Tax=Providencia huaxiensis TaxID=2027290 RepID=UPI0034E4903F
MKKCARARKCNLVPYSVKNAIKGARGSKTEPANNGGCCKGQTGHHLIYSNMIKDACPNYDEAIAPTVCVEGTSWHGGSHGRIHTAMDDELSRLVKNNKLTGNTMSMDQAIDAAVRSHKKTFPYANCSNHCIREQLKGYYLPMCKNARLPVKDSRGNEIKPDGINR